jgi:hypothetical protein
MPKKIEILEKILHILNGGDAVSDQQAAFHPAMVAEMIGESYENIIASNLASPSARTDNFRIDNYTKTYTAVPVGYDNERQEHFSTLPVEILALPFQQGVRFISPIHDQSYQYIPRSNNASAVYSELEVAEVDNVPKFYLENGMIFYKFYGLVPEKVLMKLCPAFVSLDDFDEIEMPTITTREGLITINDDVVRRFRTMPPQDLANNANPVFSGQG